MEHKGQFLGQVSLDITKLWTQDDAPPTATSGTFRVVAPAQHHLGFNGAVAAVLREERHARGMTLEGVSERSGIPAVSVQRFLAARRAINLDVLEALCRGLDTTVIEVIATAQSGFRRGDPDLVARIRAGMTPMRPHSVPDPEEDEEPEQEEA